MKMAALSGPPGTTIIPGPAQQSSVQEGIEPGTAWVVGVLGLTLAWSYWPTLLTMAERWSEDPQYSHGFLVPIFALALLWMRRKPGLSRARRPSSWGVLFLVGGLGLRLVGARLGIEACDAFSLLPTLAGLVLLVLGWSWLQWAWPAIAFLGFMVPLPYILEQALSQPLRRLATVMSCYLLETLGYPALAEGNIIHIEEIRLGVVDACSGLGMLMTFFALATALTMVIRNSWLDKAVIVASAVPIAVIANVLRITVTGVAYVSFGPQTGKFIMHDLAGWLMMPLALGFLWLELWFLERLFQEVEEDSPLLMLGLGGTPAVAGKT